MNVTGTIKRSDNENKTSFILAGLGILLLGLLYFGYQFVMNYQSSNAIEQQVALRAEATVQVLQTQVAQSIIAASATATPTETPTATPTLVQQIQPTPLPTYDLAAINAKMALLYGQVTPVPQLPYPPAASPEILVPQVITVTEIVTVVQPVEFKPVAAPGEAKLCLFGEGLTGIYVGPPSIEPLGMAGNSCIPLAWAGPVGEWKVTLTR